jgi:hypothetical protein
MGGASLWAQTVTIIPGGLTEFMLGDGRQCQLDDQDLGERHGHCTDLRSLQGGGRLASSAAPSHSPLVFSVGHRASAAAARGCGGRQHGERVSGAAGGAADEGAAGW